MKLYNSLTKKVEEFVPIEENKVKMYVCGPTVYNYPHIGNARPMVVFDLLKRVFQALGYEVEYVSNFTDVDDKIIKKAIEENTDEKTISERYIKAYNADRSALNVQMPDHTPKVTETMDDIIAFIEELERQGFAYEVDGDVYFRVNKVAEYGKISGQKIEDLSIGARIDENNKKENPLDFTLWKKTDEGIKWPTKWSEGRPGWHSECVVMINKEFNQSLIDIHGGGMDLKFPHHENERAQNKALFNTDLANYWIHNGMVNIDGSKMSKSVGNVLWAKDFVEEYGSDLVRWLLLSINYRSPLNISDQSIESAAKELQKVKTCVKQVGLKLALNNVEDNYYDKTSYDAFLDALSDDLNTPNAYKIIFDLIKELNNALRQKEIDYNLLNSKYNSLLKMLEILGIKVNKVNLTNEDKELYSKWEDAKKEKNFDLADTYRKTLQDKGIL